MPLASGDAVLVVDDDARLRHLIEVILSGAGFDVLSAEDGDRVLPMVREHQPDAVLLDLKMERVGGLEALRALRDDGNDVAVVIVSAVGEERLVLEAFEAGADDYVTKPFSSRMLLARVRAVLRRSRVVDRAARLDERVGDVSLNPRTHEACIDGRDVALSPTEYALLRTLMRAPGNVFSPDDLLTRVWGKAYAGQDEIVRANIYRLRRKLEPRPAEPRYILGRRGVGYYFAQSVRNRTDAQLS
jgi:DNA-binding response OmpR family regulator